MALGYGRTGTNNFSCAKFIVDTNGIQNGATHATIASAISDASTGDIIFIKPGTYSESLTLKIGVTLKAFAGSTTTGVTIAGKCTFTGAGNAIISGINLQTDGDYFLAVTGTAASVVTLDSCYLSVTDFTGISHTSSGALSRIQINECEGNISATGISLFTSTAAGRIELHSSYIENSADSTTASTCSTGIIVYENCKIVFPTTITGSGKIQINNSILSSGPTVAYIPLTHGGSATNSFIRNSSISSDTAAAVSIGSTLTMSLVNIDSSNANPVTGAGTVIYSGVSYSGTGYVMNASTQTGRNTQSGSISFDGGTNLLDFYEEGTWTPVLVASTTPPTTLTYNAVIGHYTRIGDIVWVYGRVDIATFTLGAGAGQLRMEGFPFTALSIAGLAPGGTVELSDVTFAGNYVAGQLQNNSKSMAFADVTTNAAVAFLAISAIKSGATINVTMVYKI